MKPQKIYETVTNKIIAELETGTAPWVKPWKSSGSPLFPHNAVTGRPYSGINVLLLWSMAANKGYSHSGWLTFRQAIALGAQVRKGEKGTHVVFVKRMDVPDDDADDEDATKMVSIIKSYVVFNLCQIDELPEAYQVVPEELSEHERIGLAESFIAALNIPVAHGGDRAAYNPKIDAVVMPPLSSFETPELYYATLFHELGHASGHATRLDRDFKGRFGTEAYAAEELVAELTSAYLCAAFSIEGQLRHASYIDSWLSLLRKDNRAIFTAASKASAAMDYLLEIAGVIKQAAE